MTEVLKLAELLEHDGEPEMDVGRGGVNAELHPQGPAEGQLALQLARRQAVHRVAGQPGSRLGRGHRSV